MARLTKALIVVGLMLALLILSSGSALMAPPGPQVTYDSITVGCGTGTSSTQSVPITAENVGDNGVMGFDITISYDHTIMTLDSVANGADYGGQPSCSPTTAIVFDDGANYAYITASCTSNPGATAVTGAQLELAVLSFSGVGGADIGPYTVSLQANALGVPTGIWGPDNVKQEATADQLLNADGCVPTAVELADMTANGAAPVALNLWPLLAGGAAVAAAGGFAFWRRKR